MLKTEFITGPAGTGKTFRVKARAEAEPGWGALCATTGIAGVNLGTQTIHSLLKYYDTESLEDNHTSGQLQKALRKVYEANDNLVLDEVSMLPAKQLNLLFHAAEEVEQGLRFRRKKPKRKSNDRGFILTGDFLQLPPIKEAWAFESDYWPRFEKNTTRLTKFWRQTDKQFLDALCHARKGEGELAVNGLRDSVSWASRLDFDFDGTTVLSKNVQVNRYNWQRLQALNTPWIYSSRYTWGESSGDWKLIPEKLELREGCLVMILANDSPEFTFANGDLGWVEEPPKDEGSAIPIRLCRNNKVVRVPRIYRCTTSFDPPFGYTEDDVPSYHSDDGDERPTEIHYDRRQQRYVIGWVDFHPLRVGYASTCHKTQGLTLDTIQLDVRDGFFGLPAMAYVGLSRVRKAEGLRVVGSPEMLAKRICMSEKVQRWA